MDGHDSGQNSRQGKGVTRRTALRAVGLAGAVALTAAPAAARAASGQPVLGTRGVDILEVDGLRFKDLSKDGVLHPYEDWRLPAEERARDLVGRMTLAEKAGTMVHPVASSSETGYHMDEPPDGLPAYACAVRPGVTGLHITSLLSRLSIDAATLAAEHNAIQEIAESTRLGIPVSMSSDPRNRFTATEGQSVGAGSFTRWPGSLGFAAIGERALVREFADACRQEYDAVGLAVALSPQADLATEPRWSRVNGTFGEDVEVVAELTAAYIEGFQAGGDGIAGPGSVVAVVKHFAGYGAQYRGYDSHYAYGRYAHFYGDAFPQHVRPFRRAVDAGAGSVMPAYSILRDVWLRDRPLEEVGAGFNRQLLTGLLRGDLGFTGVILSDWQITHDPATDPEDSTGGKPWGVEELTERQRLVKAIRAGMDQFGGTTNAPGIVAAVEAGEIDEARIDESVHRVLVQKFRQGLFENPYRDAEEAARVVGSAAFAEASRRAQARSVVLLENGGSGGPLLPLAGGGEGLTLFTRGIADPAATLAPHGMTATDQIAEADLAILRVAAPASGDHGTDLDFPPDNADYQAIVAAAEAGVPTVVAIQLDRPAVLTQVRERADALLAHFGIADGALLEVLTGAAEPGGRLPFTLPASMAAVEEQRPDVAFDIPDPLYEYGHGLVYAR
ncbi:glycoside hydrolase family 3 protein [Streptomyces sp. 6N223]|uniref:glycoside hydrolase family 3 protein n=1 Tax=Streptomyces sp. 6N223 TaxID=3457412 RepID=UPI003FD05BB8